MGKSTSIVTTTNEQDQLNGLASLKTQGNANTITTQVLDGDAIKQAFTYGGAVNAGQTQTIESLFNTVDSLAGKVITAASDNSNKTINALQSGLSSATGSIQSAYAQAANSGIDPQKALLGLAALAALAFMFEG